MAAVLLLLLVILPIFYYFLTSTHGYWKKLGVPYIAPLPIFGNLKKMILLQQSPGQFFGELYNAPEGKNQRYMGIFLWNSEPSLLVKDPELIKSIMIKDFAYFNNRNVECSPVHDPIGYNNLFVMRDKKWKFLRAKLSPIFTSGKMKLMFKLIGGVGEELVKNIDNRVKKNEREIELKELSANYTTDVISTCAFGIQSNALNDPESVFRHFGKKIFETSIYRTLELRSFFFMHWWAKITKAMFMSKEGNDFFRSVFWDAMKARERDGTNRNDFIDTLIHLKKDAAEKMISEEEDKDVFDFSGDSLVAQSVLFFTAGFETTSSTLAHALTELACSPKIQETLRREIMESSAANDGKLTYEALFEMKYLEKVVAEVLRKYPAVTWIDRICTQDYKIPDSDLTIKKGTPLFFSLYHGLHYDPQHFPDPEKFDPERFSPEVKATRHPFAYIPFGEGPHICIGQRFALMNVKSALCLILKKYKLEPTSVISMPLEQSPRCLLNTSVKDLTLKFVPI